MRYVLMTFVGPEHWAASSSSTPRTRRRSWRWPPAEPGLAWDGDAVEVRPAGSSEGEAAAQEQGGAAGGP